MDSYSLVVDSPQQRLQRWWMLLRLVFAIYEHKLACLRVDIHVFVKTQFRVIPLVGIKTNKAELTPGRQVVQNNKDDFVL